MSVLADIQRLAQTYRGRVPPEMRYLEFSRPDPRQLPLAQVFARLALGDLRP